MPTLIGHETQDVAYSASFTIPSDCTYVIALVGKTGGGATAALTLDGVTMPSADGQDNTDSLYASIHTLASPATGVKTVALSTASNAYRITLVYLKNVSGTPIIATALDYPYYGASFGMDCDSAADALVLDVIVQQTSGTLTKGTNQTVLNTGTVGGNLFGTSYRVATGTPTAMEWTSDTAQRQAHVAIAIADGTGGSDDDGLPPWFFLD